MSWSKQDIKLCLYDLTGKIIYENSYKSKSGAQAITIDNLSDLARGTYFLKIKINKATYIKKLIK